MNDIPSVMTRIPISLRLPAEVMHEVEAYASEANVRKTDAFLHFLILGIEAERKNSDADRLDALEARLDEILSLVRGNRGVLEGVSAAVSDVAPTFPAIRQVFVFGSVARGEENLRSDVDLRLVLDRNERFNLRDLEHFCKAVEGRTGRTVDVVTARTIKDRTLLAAIERDGVLIYECQKNESG